MALTADTPRTYEADAGPRFTDLPVQASVKVIEGGALSFDASGNVGPLLNTETFIGFAEDEADNSSGAAGAILARLRLKGAIKLVVVGVTGTGDIDAAVFATDDGTFTLTTAGGSQIGKVARHISSTTVIVEFEGSPIRSV